MLGITYETGVNLGIVKNVKKAKELYKKSCDGGDEKGCEDYQRINHNNKGSNEISSSTQSASIKITNFSHPDDEPKGLYIVELEVANQKKTYRLYCPKKVVRDITNNTYGKSRSVEDEDTITFGDNKVLRKAYDKICSSPQASQTITQKTSVPVVVRRESISHVQGISAKGDGFIAIRSGPGAKYKMIDKLYSNGKKVIVSDSKGKWKGLVYGNANCGKGLSKLQGQPYEGFCKTGWVYGKYVQKEGKVNRKVKELTKVNLSGKVSRDSRPSFLAPKQKKVKQLKYKILGIKSLKVVKGMYFAKVRVGGKKKEFHLFCPTNTIQDITNKHRKVERYIDLEKKLPYPDSQMVVNLFKKFCKKKVKIQTLEELLAS